MVSRKVLGCSALVGVLKQGRWAVLKPTIHQRHGPDLVSPLGSVQAWGSPWEAWPQHKSGEVLQKAEPELWSVTLTTPGGAGVPFHSCHVGLSGLETGTQRSAVRSCGGSPSACTRLQLTSGVPRACGMGEKHQLSSQVSPPPWTLDRNIIPPTSV